MLTVHGLPLLLQAGVPLALLAWQFIGPNRSVFGWLIRTTLIAGYLGAIHRARTRPRRAPLRSRRHRARRL